MHNMKNEFKVLDKVLLLYKSISLICKSSSVLLKNIFTIGFISIVFVFQGVSQTKPKQVVNIPQTWVGINSTFVINKKWDVNAEINTRENHFFQSNYSSSVRVSANYKVNENVIFTLGYVNSWTAPTTPGWHTYQGEQRPFQQISYTTKMGKISIVNRLRNEERWQQKIVGDKNTNTYIFTNRIRYLLGMTIPFSQKKYFPSLVLSDEIFMQTGQTIVYNPFDQNRAYIGLKQSFSKNLSVDLGYMLADQQKSSGYLFNRYHILKVNVSYNFDFSKHS